MSRISLVALALVAAGTLLRAEQVVFPGWGVLLAPDHAEQVVYTLGNGVTFPTLLKPVVYASYPSEAFRRKIQGKVRVEFVVLQDGTVDVDSVKVTRSVDPVYGLDDAVVKAVKQWRFKPGTKDGQPVAVRIWTDYGFSRR